MSEVVYLRCDSGDCLERVDKELAVNDGWTKDDLDADFCPNCQQVAADLETAEDAVTTGELQAFAEGLSEEADKLNEAAAARGLKKGEVEVIVAVPKKSREEQLEAQVLANLIKDLQKQKKPKKYIAEVVAEFRKQSAALRRASAALIKA